MLIKITFFSAVCTIGDKDYPEGEFINACRKCRCFASGSHICKPRCTFPRRITCAKNYRSKAIDVQVLKGCFCKKLQCITKPVLYSK